MKKLLLVLLITLFVLSGCGGNGGSPVTNPQAQGTLTLSILESGVKSQTIEPGLDMNIASYDIAGSGPSGTSFHKNNVPANGGSVTINALAAGNWTISVDAKNAAGIIIAASVANIVVFAGVSTPVEITVKPLAGTGALEVGVSWPAGIISDPVVAGILTPVGGAPMNISFMLSADGLSATYQNPFLSAGYYTLLVKLKDGTIVKWGGLESVRIIAGQTSNGAFPLTANPGSIGDIALIINPDLQNPIIISFSGQQDTIPVGSEMIVSAATSEPVDSYQWYINGTLLSGETGTEITIGSSLAPGIYRLDLVVTKGNVVSTGYVIFNVGGSSVIYCNSLGGGLYHSLYLKRDGTVWASGWNVYGQLGNGTNADSHVPVPVSNLTNIVAVTGGSLHSMALRNDGTVWTWGDNSAGELGNGSYLNSSLPVQVNNLNNVIAIAGGNLFSLALKNDGTVWAWGYNYAGQLGDGTTTIRTIPVRVSDLTNVIDIATGNSHSLAVKSDGTVWAWGYNWNGQLGNGSTYNSVLPVQVNNLSNVTAVAAGVCHSLALKVDGTVWAWGENSEGELGNGTTNNSFLPVPVANLTNVTAIVSGNYHSLALRNDGTIWGWGANNCNQLGNETISIGYLPVPVSNLTGITALETGLYHGLALKSDGSVWVWGYNGFGQLGDGTTINRNIPFMVTGF